MTTCERNREPRNDGQKLQPAEIALRLNVQLAPDIAARREEIAEVARRHGARTVRIFGSVARGTATPGSDLDLLITLDSRRSLIDLIAIKQELEDLLGRPVDVVTEAALSPYLRDEVLREAIAI
jgi:predicted nucleotidyltransferase